MPSDPGSPKPPVNDGTGPDHRTRAYSLPGHGVAWWPLRAFVTSPFERRAAPIWAAWLGLTAVSIVLAVLEATLNWSGMPVSIGTHTIGYSVYPPVLISALLAFWLGPAYGASTAYVSTLASGLAGGLGPARAAFFALGTPAGVLLLWFLTLMLRVRPDLPRYRDWWRFFAAALLATTASSLDIMLYNEAHRLPIEEGQRLWQGWIFGDTTLLCVVVAPILRFSWQRVHDGVWARLGTPHRGLSAVNTVLLLGVVWTTLAGLALVGLRLTATALEIPANAVSAGGDPLGPRMQEIETFLTVLVGVLLLSTIALTTELVESHEKSLALSLRDDLTGAFNRRAFHRLFEREHERSRAFDRPISVLYFDVDRFKSINDRHGHSVGDAVLVAVVREAQAMLRPQDLLFRWGGDEFLVLLPYTSRGDALAIAAGLRARVESHVATPEAAPTPVTISIGVATVARDASREDLVEAADAAVRLAKTLGRNRVATDEMVGQGPTGVAPVGTDISLRRPQARGESA
jgi:diguanylate cyclase (GGDEF)-like protein